MAYSKKHEVNRVQTVHTKKEMVKRKRKPKITAKSCHLDFLKVLRRMNKKELEEVISRLSDQSVDDLCSVVYNALYAKLPMSNTKRKRLHNKLKRDEKALRYVSNYKVPTALRKKKLKQTAGAIGTIIATLLPIVSSIISSIAGRKK